MSAAERSASPPSFTEALMVWVKVALLSFGGPAGQIAVMHRMIVEEKRWIGEEQFLHALNYCMLLPGPEAQQLAIYIGWLLHRMWGGIIAGVLFVLPGFLSILALSVLYALYQQTPVMEAVFYGLKPAIVAIVAHAAARIGRKMIRTRPLFLLSAAAFVAIFFFSVPFPVIIICAALFGLIAPRMLPGWFGNAAEGAGIASKHTTPKGWARAARILAFCLFLWFTPLALLVLQLGIDNVFVQLGLFFSKMAIVTFGGAYAVLAYVAQQAVEVHGWLMPGEMLDGLGMAETTPGPLIQVVQFVGFMGAYRDPGMLDPLMAGIAASVLVTWVTYIPCFLWIFLGAPYVEALRGNPHLRHMLSAITAAVVGVIANLALWFFLHVIFGRLEEVKWWALTIQRPVWGSFDPLALGLSLAALLLMLRFHYGIMRTMLVFVIAGGGLHYWLAG